MLIEFSVANYLSFKDKVTLSMEAGNIREYEEDNTFEIGKYRLLKSAAIYGANASGKSNLIMAMNFIYVFIINSSKDTQSGEKINIEPFKLSTATENQPSFFEIVLLIEEITYRYGFEVTQKEVVSEWLFENKKKEKILFLREKGNISIGNGFKEGKDLEEKTRDNALFLSAVAQWNGKIANDILKHLRTTYILEGLKDSTYSATTVIGLNLDVYKNKIKDFIRYADLNIEDIIVDNLNIGELDLLEMRKNNNNYNKLLNTANESDIFVLHNKFDENNKKLPVQVSFDLKTSESSGTQKYFNLAGHINGILQNGYLLIIDEIDAKLHPVLTKQIIKLFNSKETNPNNAQLIFATHDTNLLSAGFLRRDQIWFTEKNKQGATDLYSLLEFKLDDDSKVRNDASFEKDYLKGRYGAIPYLGDFSKIFKPEN